MLILVQRLEPGSSTEATYDDGLSTGTTDACRDAESLSEVRLTTINRSNHPALNHSDVSIAYSSRELDVRLIDVLMLFNKVPTSPRVIHSR